MGIPLTHLYNAIEIAADGTTQKGSIRMFQPQPEPPGEPLVELTADPATASIKMGAPDDPASKIMELYTTDLGASLEMAVPHRDIQSDITDPLLRMWTAESGGGINLADEIGRYMGIEPSPFSPGGLLMMINPTTDDTSMTLTSDGEITLDNDTNGLESRLTAGNMEMKYSDPTGGSGPPIHMETSSTSAKIGIGIDSPDNELHVVGSVKIVDGTQGAGKVLTSDANGVGTWQPIVGLAGDQIQELLDIVEMQNARISQLEARIAELEQTE
jgi:hypothetical protein